MYLYKKKTTAATLFEKEMSSIVRRQERMNG